MGWETGNKNASHRRGCTTLGSPSLGPILPVGSGHLGGRRQVAGWTRVDPPLSIALWLLEQMYHNLSENTTTTTASTRSVPCMASNRVSLRPHGPLLMFLTSPCLD